MLRPTPKEVLAGVQRTIIETLLPEVSSPFAQAQAMTAAGVLGTLTGWIESFPRFEQDETADLKRTFDALRPHADSGIIEAAGYREALESGVQASDEEPPDRRAMESALGELAAGVALHRIAGPVAHQVRGYLARHLERIRKLCGQQDPFAAG